MTECADEVASALATHTADVAKLLANHANDVVHVLGAQPHAEGLLHLAALSVAVSAVYLGVDRIHKEEFSLSEFLNRSGAEARRLLKRGDWIKDGVVTIDEVPLADKLSVLAQIASVPMVWKCNGGIRFALKHRFMARWRLLPFHRYFRRRWDRTFVAIYGMIATVIFLGFVGATVVNVHSPHASLIASYVFLAPGLAWIFLTGWAAAKLHAVPKIYEMASNNLEKELKAMEDAYEKKTQEARRRLTKLGNGGATGRKTKKATPRAGTSAALAVGDSNIPPEGSEADGADNTEGRDAP